MITENLSTLKIHKLSQSQYEKAVESGNVESNALYLTPVEDDIKKHNSSTTAHEDIRKAVSDNTKRVNNLEEDLNIDKQKIEESKSQFDIKSVEGVNPVINNGANTSFYGMKLYGKTTQPTTTGKNLFGGEVLADEIVSKFKGDKDTTNKTVTYSCNNVDNIVLFDDFKENQQYTIVLNGNCTAGTFANIRIAYTDGTDTGSLTFGEDGTGCHVSAKGKSVRCISGHWSNGYTTLNYEKCGIFEGVITLEEFEPYSGLQPSPSPQYPQHLESKGELGDSGQMEIESVVSNGQLFDKTNYEQGRGISTSNGGTYSAENVLSTAFIKVKGMSDIAWNGYVTDDKKATFGAFYDENKAYVSGFTVSNYVKTVQVPNGASFVRISFRMELLDTLMINEGTEVLPFIEYVEPQSHISLVSDGLKGIPVTDSSLATYTDENGQMWCSDYVDCEKNVDVQKVETVITNDTSKIYYNANLGTVSRIAYPLPKKGIDYTPALCSHLQFKVDYSGDYEHFYVSESNLLMFISNEYLETLDTNGVVKYLSENPITAQYILKEPIETPLSADEIASYKALHTNNPNTTIMNDCDAFMKVGYLDQKYDDGVMEVVEKIVESKLEAFFTAYMNEIAELVGGDA